MLSFPFRFQKPASSRFRFAAIYSTLTKDTREPTVRTLRSTLTVVAVLILFFVVTSTAQQPELTVQMGHVGWVNSLAYSPDGKLLASGGYDKKIHLWDVSTGRELRPLTGAGEVSSLAFSADGKRLASCRKNAEIVMHRPQTVNFWDVTTGRKLPTPIDDRGAATLVAFSSDGTTFATAGENQVQLWSLRTGQRLSALVGHQGSIRSIAFSPDGMMLASGGFGDTIKLWDVGKGRLLHTLIGHSNTVNSVAFNSAGTLLASGSIDRKVKLWNTMNGELVGTLVGHENSVRSVAFSPDGKTLASGSEDQFIALWDVKTQTAWGSVIVGYTAIHSICFSPDGKTLAGGGYGGLIGLFDSATGRVVGELDGHSLYVSSVATSPDGKMVGVGNGNYVRLWDLTTGRQSQTLSGHSDWVTSIAFSPNGKILASGSKDQTTKLWNVATGKEVSTLKGHSHYVYAVAFSVDGKTLATGSYDGTIKLWDVSTGSLKGNLTGHSGWVTSVAFSPDGKNLASGGVDSTIKVWDLSTTALLRTLSGQSGWVSSIAFGGDGQTLASGVGSVIQLWRVTTGEQLGTLVGHSGFVYSVAFSPNGKILASGSEDQTIKLWDVRSGQQLRVLSGHTDWTNSVAFAAGGDRLISGSADSTTKLWSVNSGELQASLISFNPAGWTVVAPDGRFDTNSVEEIPNLQWVFPDDPFKPLPPEVFMRQYYEPQLLPRLIAGDDFKEVPLLTDLNRAQPKVTITEVKKDGPGTAAVAVDVENVERTYERSGNPTIQSGAKDLRLFRDGQLVSYRDGDLLGKQSAAGRCEPIAGNAKKCKAVFEHIRLPQQDNVKDVEFSAYVFNTSDVKSETARYPFPYTRELPSKKGRVYLITVGVSKYENPEWNLEFAANDAHLIDETVSAKLRATGDYEDVVNVMLTSEELTVDGQRELVKTATKENFRNILRLLAGEKLNESEMKAFPNAQKIEKATPEDVVLIFYSSHGYRDEERFYLFPYDIGQGTGRDPDAVVAQAISSDDLYRWLRDVDAGDLVLVIDACHAAAVTGKEFKPGPMGSRGMGQLAYDKGMRILAATQPDTTAAEVDNIDQKRKIQHGLLTYALIQDGLVSLRADRNEDKVILLPEWLEYGVIGVPKLYEEVAKSQNSTDDQPIARSQQRGANRVRFISKGEGDTSTQQPSLFDFTGKLKRKRQLVVYKT